MWSCHPSNRRWSLFSLPLESGLALWLASINRMWQKWQWAFSVHPHLLDALWLPCKGAQAGLLEDEGQHGESQSSQEFQSSPLRPQTHDWGHLERSAPYSSLPTPSRAKWLQHTWAQVRPAEELSSWAWPKLQDHEQIHNCCFSPLNFRIDCWAEMDNRYVTKVRC